MAAYDTLRAAIDNYIKANGNKEITGAILNDILNAMVTALGADTRFAGVATPSTNPGNPEGNVIYFASQAGTYSNFGSIVLPLGIHILLWNGTTWTSQTWFSVDNTPTQNSQNLVTSGGILQAIVDAVGVERLRAIGAEVTSCSFNGTTKKISFFNSANTTLFQLDATAFVIDGMVSDVTIEDGNLVIKFNTDAGKQDIEIPITEIFNPDNYYTKTAIDTLLQSYYTKTQIDNLLTAINSRFSAGYLYKGVATPATNPSTQTEKVFYITTTAGTYPYFLDSNNQPIVVKEGEAILKYDGTSWSLEQYRLTDGGVFDVTAYSGSSFASLDALLSDANLNNLIPVSVRKGGMSIKFVQSSDNKYIQARCMAQNFTTDVAQWQGVDDVPSAGSENLIKSGGVYNKIHTDHSKEYLKRSGGTAIQTDGTLIDVSSASYNTKKYAINPKLAYKASGRTANTIGTCAIAYYDANDNFISYEKASDGTATNFSDYLLTIPSNACYVRVAGNNGVMDSALFLSYELSDVDTLIDVAFDDKNKDNKIDAIVTPIFVSDGGNTLSVDGEIVTSSSTTTRVKKYSVSQSKEYKANGRRPGSSDLCMIAYYTAGDVFISSELVGNGTAKSIIDYILTVPNNAAYVCISGNTASRDAELYVLSNSSEVSLLKTEQALTNEEKSQVKKNLDLPDSVDNTPTKDSPNIVTSGGVYAELNSDVSVVAEGDALKKIISKADGSYLSTSSDTTHTKTYIVNPSYPYKASGRIGNNSDAAMIGYYDINGVFLGYEIEGGSARNVTDYSLTIPANTFYVKVTGNTAQQDTVLILSMNVKTDVPIIINDINHIKEDVFNNNQFSLNGKTIAIIGASIETHGNSGTDCNAVEITIEPEDVGVELSAYLTYNDVNAGLSLGGHTFTSDEIGNEVTFTPTTEDVGKKIGLPLTYNSNSLNVWWTYVRDFFGCKIIPVCWSGSGYTRNRQINEVNWYTSHAWHEAQIRKCGIRTPGTMTRIAPDVIFLTRGLNDWTHTPYARITDGFFDVVDWEYPTSDKDQNDNFGFLEGYCLTVKKLREAYPFTPIVMFTHVPTKRVNNSHFPANNGFANQPQYNQAIRDAADFLGCQVVDRAKCAITWENMYPTYVNDSASTPTHPNAKGHEVIGKFVINELKKLDFSV